MDAIIHSLIPSTPSPQSQPLPCSQQLYLESYQQHTRALCGFHALFNALTYLKSQGKDLCSAWKFWKFHTRIVSFLIKNADLSPQETAKLQDSGPLERHQMTHLLSHFPLIPHSQVRWVPLYFAFNHFQMSLEELAQVDEVMSLWRKGDIRYIVFLLGVTNHWSVLIYEHCESGYRSIYLDSKNRPEVFSTYEADLNRLITIENELRVSKGLELMTAYQVKMRIQHAADIQRIVSIIQEVATSRCNFTCFLLTQEILTLHATFIDMRQSQEKGSSLVRKWVFEAFQPVSEVLDGLIGLAEATTLHPSSAGSMLQWMESLATDVNEGILTSAEGEEKQTDLKRFLEVFPRLLRLLKRVEVINGG